ncbi:nicotinate phosphoribosyltransferase [Variovorax paradoxus]|jgi:nicotinamide phosphoribosyltransferase|uniref:nicotinate phosphoribosyltransferase n=1 Tax=Variovorax TaxID=34072 RepID=UPI0006E55F88|nr:nicotinate phosphoribosyltransferase [Variovorax paradoxus]KPU96076.1 nicotinate phosphoribosyltransferase [Variovorax paradoxus]KPV05034.1 nicotinate phosphoribosyltransferase [Variovorax paradoxus]KPV09877.1 nicotinate phosphoribosyltransferase [Variovorax paradoxus]KPV19439.1 nicotinate phosphoribosyltransferase [Variovorax paradoxus]
MNRTLSPSLGSNLLLRTDSYKVSHWMQYPPGTQTVFSYIESRGGLFSHSLFFGLQAYLREYLQTPVTRDDVDEAAALMAVHGEPFNREGWLRLIEKHGGLMPVRIRAVPEGSVLPVHNVLATIENTDPEFFWVTSFLETELLRAIWYPTTVATVSAAAKTTLLRYLEATCDDPQGQIAFKLHDFGARGVSSLESAALGGMAHLVNFMGTDTLSALMAARRYYDCDVAGFSIPAAEHSTITGWGREHEADAYRNMVAQFGKPGAIFAVVSDSYDIFNACARLWGDALREQVIRSGATLVVRPDSGDPAETTLKVAQILAERFGTTTNAKGFRVLNNVRIIQGDGVTLDSLRLCLSNFFHNGFSAENIAFGMGGGLLQQVNRDTMQWAMKCSAMQVDGEWRDVYKAPVGDTSKTSKKGRLVLAASADGEVRTQRAEQVLEPGQVDLLETVYENGRIVRESSFEGIRGLAASGVGRLVTSRAPL